MDHDPKNKKQQGPMFSTRFGDGLNILRGLSKQPSSSLCGPKIGSHHNIYGPMLSTWLANELNIPNGTQHFYVYAMWSQTPKHRT